MVDQLSLYNRALRHLKVRRLANLNENVLARHELDAVYAEVLQAVLEKAGWKFAIRTSQLTADNDIEPGFGLSYVYGLPDDFVRWAAICVDDMFQVEDSSFEEKNGLLYSDNSTLYVKYVSNSPDYGLDLGQYPENYAELVGTELAERTCIPITKDDSLLNVIETRNRRNLARAKTFDAIKDHVQFKPTGALVSARIGGVPTPYFRNGKMHL